MLRRREDYKKRQWILDCKTDKELVWDAIRKEKILDILMHLIEMLLNVYKYGMRRKERYKLLVLSDELVKQCKNRDVSSN